MIALIATLQVAEGKAEEFEDLFRELMGLVRAEEPGTLVYRLAKSRKEANTYKVVELYQDQAALDGHGKGPTVAPVFGRIGSFMAGRPHIELLDAVV